MPTTCFLIQFKNKQLSSRILKQGIAGSRKKNKRKEKNNVSLENRK